MSDRYRDQIARLQALNPGLAAAVDSTPPSVVVEATKSGVPTAAIPIAGKPLLLHSRYDPRNEAEQFAASSIKSPTAAHVLIGFGLGYHAQALLSRISRAAPLLIFEDNPSVLRAALEHIDLSAFLGSPHVHWFGGEALLLLREALLARPEWFSEGAEVYVPPIIGRLSPDYVAQIRQLIDEVATYSRMMLTTRLDQGRRTVANVIGNLRRYASALPLDDLRTQLSGQPALVVAAGPSLVRNRHLLAQAKERFLLIAVGAVLKQLLGLGVMPDFVVQIDHSDVCLRHFQGIDDFGDMILFADPAASAIVLDCWRGRIAMPENGFAGTLLGDAAPRLPAIRQGTTVAHTAFYLAEWFGADPVAFVGQDLAFTDALYYSAGNGIHEVWRPELNRFFTVETKEWERLVRRKSDLRTTVDWSGQTIYTDRQMFNYLQQFECDFARCRSRVIDCTEGGARKQGAAPMTLAQALAELGNRALPRSLFSRESEGSGSLDADRFLYVLQKSQRRLREFARLAAEIVKEQRRCLERFGDDRRLQAGLQRIGTLQQSIQSQYLDWFQFLVGMAAELDFERGQATRRIETGSIEPRKKLRLEIERDLAYVEGLRHVANELNEQINSATSIESG